MNSKFVLKSEDIVILGEKENRDDTNNSVDFDNSDDRVASSGEVEQSTKSINGGPGSGNFGHSGRPGEVGGSAPRDMSVANPEKIAKAEWFEEHRDFLKSRGYTDAAIDEFIITSKRQELKKKAVKATTVKNFDKIVEEMKAEGFYSDAWWDTIGKPTREFLVGKEQRQKDAVTPEQQEAIDNMLADTQVYMKATDEKWMRKNVPEVMVKELHSELNKAFEEGLNRNIRIQFTNAQRRLGSCTVEGPNYETVLMRLSKNEISNAEYNLTMAKQKGVEGSRWWTCKPDQIGSTIRHELGHALAWQALRNMGESVYNYYSVNGKIVHNAKKTFAGLKPTDQVYGSNIPPKSAVKLSSLRKNEGLKYMSKYGLKNNAEAVAEAYTNPDYSDFTKAIYKELKKILKG